MLGGEFFFLNLWGVRKGGMLPGFPRRADGELTARPDIDEMIEPGDGTVSELLSIFVPGFQLSYCNMAKHICPFSSMFGW